MEHTIERLKIDSQKIQLLNIHKILESKLGDEAPEMFFTKSELENILTFISIYHLYKDSFEKKNHLANDLLKNKTPVYIITRAFMLHMLGNMEEFDKKELYDLVDKPIKKTGFLENPNLERLSEELLLESFLGMRSYEFGVFFLKQFSHNLFKNKSVESINRMQKKVMVAKDISQFLKTYFTTDLLSPKLSREDCLLLALSFKQKLLPKHLTIKDAAIIGVITRQNMTVLNKQYQYLKVSVDNIINYEIKQYKGLNKGKGPKL